MSAKVYINEKPGTDYSTVIIQSGFVDGIVDYCKERDIYYSRQMTVPTHNDSYEELYRLLYFLLSKGASVFIRPERRDEWTALETLEDFDNYVAKVSLPHRYKMMEYVYEATKKKVVEEMAATSAWSGIAGEKAPTRRTG